MSDVPPPPPPGGAFPPPPGGGFPPPTPPGGDGGGGGFAPYAGYGTGVEKAGFWSRFAAALLDTLIVGAFSIPARIVAAAGPSERGFCEDFRGDTYRCDVPNDTTSLVVVLLSILAFVAGVIYYAKLEGQGATVGKRALGLRVQDATTGQPIGTARAVGRYFARILSAIPCFLGYLWMLWDDQRQTWHDKLTSSVVVRNP
jgi:uncharacterized RDD family membrane protein YckC